MNKNESSEDPEAETEKPSKPQTTKLSREDKKALYYQKLFEKLEPKPKEPRKSKKVKLNSDTNSQVEKPQDPNVNDESKDFSEK